MSSSDRRAILVVHAVPADGGSARVAVEDAKSLLAGGFRVGVAIAGRVVPSGLEEQDIAVHRLYFVDPARTSKVVRYLVGAPLSTIVLWWLVWRHRYSALYVQHRQSGWPSRIVSTLTGAQYVFISHSELGVLNRGRWATPLGTNVIAVAEHVKRNIVTNYGVPAGQVAVIPNAVSANVRYTHETALDYCWRRWQIPVGAPVVACVANLVPVKGHDVLLEAWVRVIRDEPDARLLLAGTGPLEGVLQQRCRDLLLFPSVHFVGYVADISVVHARADVAVLASRSEGMPLSVIDSFAHGVPVVATAVPGVREVVADGETGLIVPVGDADGLARALLRLLTNPEGRRRMGAAARMVVAGRFLPEFRREKICDFFRAVVST